MSKILHSWICNYKFNNRLLPSNNRTRKKKRFLINQKLVYESETMPRTPSKNQNGIRSNRKRNKTKMKNVAFKTTPSKFPSGIVGHVESVKIIK